AGFVPSGSDDSGGVITVDWDSLPLGQSATITYEATLVPGVITGTSVVNTGDLDWTSLVDSGDPHSRDYADSDDHTILVSEPGVAKDVFATSEPSTGSGQFGPDPELTIGEQVTYRMLVGIPEDVTPAAQFVDQLPTVSATFLVLFSRAVEVCANLSAAGLPAVGAPGVHGDSDSHGTDDRVTWSLGDIANPPTGAPQAEQEIEFE